MTVSKRLRPVLEEVRARCDTEARLALDPVAVVHRYPRREDKELVGLVASAVAFGNVKALRAKLEDALVRLGPDVANVADDEDELRKRLRGWKHRVYRDEDLVRLLLGARRVQREHGSLGALFESEFARTKDLRSALISWVAAIREAGGLGKQSRGAAHILADPSGASGCKRLLLYLRWMARPDDGVDLGLWQVPSSELLIPVDTHIHKLARNLGLTDRKAASWATAEEITAKLRRFDPVDPVKYDFSLCHLGMSRRCPSHRDPVLCDGCGIKAVCRHWRRHRPEPR